MVSQSDMASGADSGWGRIIARPELLRKLGGPERVTVLSAPAGSGKTELLRSWVSQPGPAGRTAWVEAGQGNRDPLQFWLTVYEALRATDAGANLVRPVSAAPDLDGGMLAEWLLTDLAALKGELWLVIDDAHELVSPEVREQLKQLVMRAPRELRFVFATRRDVPLALHRLRLDDDLSEVRPSDLQFTKTEIGQLLSAAGVNLPSETVMVLHRRTEGWATSLRMAVRSLVGHPDPQRFVENFSGTDRRLAEYLIAEVLNKCSEKVRRILLLSSILDWFDGELVDHLTGDTGAERELQDMEAAGAFVVSLGADRTRFRYHHLFAELLRSELPRTYPADVPGLHRTAAQWLAIHGRRVEAIRHYQHAGDWDKAARLLADHWPSLHLHGQAAMVHDLLAKFPSGMAAMNTEYAVVSAADELAHGFLDGAERLLDQARRWSKTTPETRPHLRLLMELIALLIARQRGNLATVIEKVERVEALIDEAPDTALAYSGEELRALALISLADTEFWTGKIKDAQHHAERGAELARQARQPYLEFTGVTYQALMALNRRHKEAHDYASQAVELAQRHGWTSDPIVGAAHGTLGTILMANGQLDEAEASLQCAERVLPERTQPTWSTGFRYMGGILQQARGHDAEALAVFESAEPLLRRLPSQHYLVPWMHASRVQAMVRLGRTDRAEWFLNKLPEAERGQGELRIATADLRLAQGNPHAAAAELAPVITDTDTADTDIAQVVDGTDTVNSCFWLLVGWLTEAAVRDALGDDVAARAALERTLDLTEPDSIIVPFLLFPRRVPKLLDRHARHGTHAALIATIRNLMSDEPAHPPSMRTLPFAQLTKSELRVLRCLSDSLTYQMIADELSLTVNTVSTHMKSLFLKLGVHSKAEAVKAARTRGLL